MRGLLVLLVASGCSAPSQPGPVGAKDVPEEARTNLTGIYVAEKAFFGEYGTYATDLESVAWKPDAKRALGFVYGFCNEHPQDITGISDYDGARRTSTLPSIAGGRAGVPSSPRALELGDPCLSMTADLRARFAAAGMSHRAYAARNLDADGALEIWSINEIKEYRLESIDRKSVV